MNRPSMVTITVLTCALIGTILGACQAGSPVQSEGDCEKIGGHGSNPGGLGFLQRKEFDDMDLTVLLHSD